MDVRRVLELVTVILLGILSTRRHEYFEVSGIQLGHAIVAHGSKDEMSEASEMALVRKYKESGFDFTKGTPPSGSINDDGDIMIGAQRGFYFHKADADQNTSSLPADIYIEDSSSHPNWPKISPSSLDLEKYYTNSTHLGKNNDRPAELPMAYNRGGDIGLLTNGSKVGAVSLPRETISSREVYYRIKPRKLRLQEIFISKEESSSFLGKSRKRRRGGHEPNKGPVPIKDLNTAKFKNFRYRFPERTEWFPSYVEVWEMCVYKRGRKFEGILGKNRWRKWCKWEEVYEIHVEHHDEGFSYEFASATMAYINCLRNDKDPHAKRDNCPKPCTSNPCKGPHMSRCSETGTDVSKSYTCHCNPGWKYNSKARKCDDLNVCGTSKEQCSKTNTIECVEKEGYKHECVCDRKWMGPRCEKPYDACVDYDNPCGQYGICTAHAGQRTWTCKCMEGWGDDPAQEGRDCKRKNKVCDNVVCLNGGECQASKSQSKATCICSEEWKGDTCNEPMPSWTMWQPWSKCSVSCGYDGTRIRKRDCDHKDAVFCGPGTDEEHAVCNGPLCKVDGEWAEWIKVTDCSYNCGGGHYIQARNCEYDSDDPEAFGKSCEGRAIVYADCNIMSCPKSEKRWLRVDINSLARTIVSQTDNAAGDWGAWNSWADCSTTCDVGFRSRNRICLSSIGACVGSSEEIEDCNMKHCDKEAGFLSWGSWTYWTKCEQEVDFCYRYRECPYSITDKEFREACPGKSSQSVPCDEDGCGELQEEEVKKEKEVPKEEKQDAGVEQVPPWAQGGAQWVQPMQAPPDMARQRGAAAGESSALGVGSVAALGAIAYMGKILFTKFQKKRKRQKKKKNDAAV